MSEIAYLPHKSWIFWGLSYVIYILSSQSHYSYDEDSWLFGFTNSRIWLSSITSICII